VLLLLHVMHVTCKLKMSSQVAEHEEGGSQAAEHEEMSSQVAEHEEGGF
jgi:hypothetical protein